MAKLRNPRRDVVASFTPLIQEWEQRGMPMLGSMLRITRWAYQHGLEGSLESLMNTWFYSADALKRKTLGHAYETLAQSHPDSRPETPATIARHADKHRALRGLAAAPRSTLKIKKGKRHAR